MASLIIFGAIISTTIINMMIGAFWYSMKGFGPIWINYYFGNTARFELSRAQNPRNLQTIMLISMVCQLLYSVLLLVIINNVFAPHTLMDLLRMSAFITAIYLLLETPHIGFENRSYGALFIHAAYHYIITFIPLFIYKIFFKFPTSYIKF